MDIRKWILLGNLLFGLHTYGQQLFGISSAAASSDALRLKKLIDDRPKELTFGIRIDSGKVWFQLSNESWFHKIFSGPTDGVTADLVSRAQLTCNRPFVQTAWNRGTLLPPVLRDELRRRLRHRDDGAVEAYLGPVPAALANQELEGNLAIVRQRQLCFYTNFTSIDESLWELLDMGLYTDSLMRTERNGGSPLLFARKMTVTVPFRKATASYTEGDIRPLYDSLRLASFAIRKISIRSFASVDGSADANLQLQRARSASILSALQGLQRGRFPTEIHTGENWVEFVRSVEGTPYAYLGRASKADVRQALKDPTIAAALEPVLAQQRKAVITLYLDAPGAASQLTNDSLAARLRQALRQGRADDAVRLQQQAFARIADKRMPATLIEGTDIPESKSFSRFVNDRNVYRYLLHQIAEGDALKALQPLLKADPGNGKLLYNSCALRLRLWQYNDKAVDRVALLRDIGQLENLGIAPPLVRRMQINYRILLCELEDRAGNFDAKDRVLAELRSNYLGEAFSDEDLLSLGRFFSNYEQYGWADDLLSPRLDQVDVSADLLFFYLNLTFFTTNDFTPERMRRMLLNAIGIDNERFCRFFNSTDRGGVSMQLVLESFWRNVYCENCAVKRAYKTF